MAQLPVIKRFLTEDFPTQQSWIGSLLYPLNQLLTTIYACLNRGITLQQNCLAQVKTLQVVGSSPSVSFSYQFSPAIPIGVSVISVVQTSTPSVALTAAVGCTYFISNGILTVTVQGLSSTSTYNVTFVVWGG